MGTLVGRDAELARLRALLSDAAAGRAVTALVSGDAGVGKSRLVAEAMRVAANDGFTVLCGQCAEIGDSVPYLPFADAFRSAPPHIEKAVKARPVLARLLPDGDAGPDEADWAGLTRQQMFGAVLGLLAELAATSPVLLVIEDLHWADATTRHLVAFLTRMLHRERVAIIGTFRTDDLHRRHPLRAVIAELQRLPSVRHVELGPLPAAALAEHLASLAEVRPPGREGRGGASRLSAATLNSLVDRAEGNAYYAEELLNVSANSPDSLPSGLAALLLSRVERVSDAAQQVLRAAAVAGRRAGDDLIRSASGLPDDVYDEAIREVVAHQLLVPDGDGYRFRHALLREAVYGDLLPGERTRLHAKLAMLLCDVPGTAAELAHHSLRSHDIPGGFASSVRAGAEAERIGAPAEAHRHYDQALELWDRVDEAEKLVGMTRGKLGLKSALAAAASGEVPRAVHLLRRIRATLPDDADQELCARVGERLSYYLLQGENKEWYAEALRTARQTVRETPDDPPAWYQARAMATYAIALMAEGGYGVALEWAQRAREVARKARSASVEADALVTIGRLSSRGGNSDEAIGMFTAAYEQAAAAKTLGVELRAAYHLAEERLVRGELTEAATIADAGVERAEAEGLGLAPFGLDLQHLHFQAHYADGAWDHAQNVADGFPVRVTRPAEAVLSAMALFVDVARGNPVVAERRSWLEPFWGDVFVAYVARGLFAEHAAWRGDTDAALAEAEAAMNAESWPTHSPSVIRVAAVALGSRADRAAALRAAGDTAGADAEVAAGAELLDVARAGAARRGGVVLDLGARPVAEDAKTAASAARLGPEGRGWLARCEAEYARLAGANSPSAWEKVITEFGPGYVYETARTQWRLAEALVEAGRRDEAVPVWHAAHDTASALRAAPLTRALDDLARRARLDTGNGSHGNGSRGPAGPRVSRLAGLTDREREVLRLLTRGMSNREIGAELFITPKTASVHVSNILAKLGAASRTEAAAIAYRDGA